jgi:tRNA nucleotidyltransferase/poly(A) polymerase
MRRSTQAVLNALTERGFGARAVGGAVRNALLGRAVDDVDIATTARPEQVTAAAEAAGLRAVATGIAHGTVTVLADHIPFQVTTLREDVETHGRHATVAFTDNWAVDARRRDFTINALYCDASGQILDPLGGYPDILARRVRFIGDAGERIREDYLRVLRFFRFTAEYGLGPADAIGLAACVEHRHGLARLSAERVRQELLRLLAAERGPELVRLLHEYGLLTLVLGVAPRLALLEALAAIEGAFPLSADPVLRLAALAVEVEEDAGHLRDRLRLSGEEHARLARAALRAPALGPTVPEQDAKAYLYAAGAAAFRDRVLLAWARSGDAPGSERWRWRAGLAERWRVPRFPIGGADVLAQGVPAGPRVGEILRELEAWWIGAGFAADEAALRAKLAELLAA